MLGYRINWDIINAKLSKITLPVKRAKDQIVEVASMPETKLIVKAAGKSLAGSAVIGVTAGAVLHSVPVVAFAVAVLGGGAWGYRCGKQLDRQLAELYAKRLTEDPVLKDILQNAIDRLQIMNPEMQVPVFN